MFFPAFVFLMLWLLDMLEPSPYRRNLKETSSPERLLTIYYIIIFGSFQMLDFDLDRRRSPFGSPVTLSAKTIIVCCGHSCWWIIVITSTIVCVPGSTIICVIGSFIVCVPGSISVYPQVIHRLCYRVNHRHMCSRVNHRLCPGPIIVCVPGSIIVCVQGQSLSVLQGQSSSMFQGLSTSFFISAHSACGLYLKQGCWVCKEIIWPAHFIRSGWAGQSCSF